MFGVVYSSIQKFTIILIMKPIIFILILNKYLDISIYLDSCTPLDYGDDDDERKPYDNDLDDDNQPKPDDGVVEDQNLPIGKV